MNYNRKKQPEQVRRALLQCAAKVAAEVGVSGVTVMAVAEAAGVSKGGLLHHFSNKQALLDGMVIALLERLDYEIDTHIAKDPSAFGSFTRAYVESVFVGEAFGFESPWATLFMAVINDRGLRRHWVQWIEERLSRHKDSDGDPNLQLVRLAADGAWLAYITADSKSGWLHLDGLKDHLLSLTERVG
jgi:AcrR family transcriptional regulator